MPHGFENIFRKLELLSKPRQHDHRLRKYQFSPGKNPNPLLEKNPIHFVSFFKLPSQNLTLTVSKYRSYSGGKSSHVAHKQLISKEN